MFDLRARVFFEQKESVCSLLFFAIPPFFLFLRADDVVGPARGAQAGGRGVVAGRQVSVVCVGIPVYLVFWFALAFA